MRLPILCLLQASLALAQSSAPHYTPMGADLKYLKCPVCKATAQFLHNAVAVEAEKSKPSQAEVASVIEDICKPDPAKNGVWILYHDVIERNGILELRRHDEQGACRRECKTIQAACQDLLDNLDDVDELQVALWKGKSQEHVTGKLCTEWSSACGGKDKKVTHKRENEMFVTQEQAREEQLARLKEQQRRMAAAANRKAKSQKQQSTQVELSLVSKLVESTVAGAMQMVKDLEGAIWGLWKDYKKFLTYKEAKKLCTRLSKDMHRDLYQKMTWKRVKTTGLWLWKIHQPQALYKDLNMRAVFQIYAPILLIVLLLEVAAFAMSRVKVVSEPGTAGQALLGLSVVFCAVCTAGIYFKI